MESVLSREKSIASSDEVLQETNHVKKLPDRQRIAMESFLQSPNGLNWDDLVRSMKEETFIQTITFEKRCNSIDGSSTSSLESHYSRISPNSSLSSRSKRRSKRRIRIKVRKKKKSINTLERKVEKVIAGRGGSIIPHRKGICCEKAPANLAFSKLTTVTTMSRGGLDETHMTTELDNRTAAELAGRNMQGTTSRSTLAPITPLTFSYLPPTEPILEDENFYYQIRPRLLESKIPERLNNTKSPYSFSSRYLLPSVEEERVGDIPPFPTFWDSDETSSDYMDEELEVADGKFPKAISSSPPIDDCSNVSDTNTSSEKIGNLQLEMQAAAKDLQFEEAAKFRDHIAAIEELRICMEKAAKVLKFEEAAKFRDEIRVLEELFSTRNKDNHGSLGRSVAKFSSFLGSDEVVLDSSGANVVTKECTHAKSSAANAEEYPTKENMTIGAPSQPGTTSSIPREAVELRKGIPPGSRTTGIDLATEGEEDAHTKKILARPPPSSVSKKSSMWWHALCCHCKRRKGSF